MLKAVENWTENEQVFLLKCFLTKLASTFSDLVSFLLYADNDISFLHQNSFSFHPFDLSNFDD